MDKIFYRKNTKDFFIGKKVKTLVALCNGYYKVPKGAIFEITDKQGGFRLVREPCDCCGVRLFFSRVSPSKVELIK